MNLYDVNIKTRYTR